MGYVIAQGLCWVCGRPFAFNPMKVPSMRQEDGRKEPVCLDCMTKANLTRKKNGMAPLPIAPDAYSPINEEDLPDDAA